MLMNSGRKPAAIGHKQKKRGFTLTEIAIVLGIIGLILGAIWAAASSVYANLRANQAQQGILATAQAVRSMFATSSDTGQTAVVNITSAGMFPVSWTSQAANGTVGNPWHLSPPAASNYAYVLGFGQLFAIQLDGISDAGCAQLAAFYSISSAGGSGGQVPGLISTIISPAADPGPSAAPTSLATGWPGPGEPPNPKLFDPATDCNQGGLQNGISIMFDMSVM